jgi:hypothetical protein
MSDSFSPEQSRLVSRLHELMDRLTSPELTAAESEDLRPRLYRLLEQIEAGRDGWGAALDVSPRRDPEPCPAA